MYAVLPSFIHSFIHFFSGIYNFLATIDEEAAFAHKELAV